MSTLFKLHLLGVAMLFSTNMAYAQNTIATPEAINIDRTFGGPVYYQDRTRLSIKKVKDILAVDEAAIKRFKNGHAMSATATVLAAAGGFCFGFTLGNILQGADVEPALVVAGGAAIIACVPLSIIGNKQCLKAVNDYNEGIGKVSRQRYGNGLDLCANNNGVGIQLHF